MMPLRYAMCKLCRWWRVSWTWIYSKFAVVAGSPSTENFRKAVRYTVCVPILQKYIYSSYYSTTTTLVLHRLMFYKRVSRYMYINTFLNAPVVERCKKFSIDETIVCFIYVYYQKLYPKDSKTSSVRLANNDGSKVNWVRRVYTASSSSSSS